MPNCLIYKPAAQHNLQLRQADQVRTGAQDLLRPENNDLQIREGEAGVYVAGVHEAEVTSMEACLHLLQLGDRNRCGSPLKPPSAQQHAETPCDLHGSSVTKAAT